MNTNRPCTCGCTFKRHTKVNFAGSEASIYYCKTCDRRYGSWCYTYTPIDNLKYLELLEKQKDNK